jgi:hypothetical protein
MMASRAAVDLGYVDPKAARTAQSLRDADVARFSGERFRIADEIAVAIDAVVSIEARPRQVNRPESRSARDLRGATKGL